MFCCIGFAFLKKPKILNLKSWYIKYNLILKPVKSLQAQLDQTQVVKGTKCNWENRRHIRRKKRCSLIVHLHVWTSEVFDWQVSISTFIADASKLYFLMCFTRILYIKQTDIPVANPGGTEGAMPSPPGLYKIVIERWPPNTAAYLSCFCPPPSPKFLDPPLRTVINWSQKSWHLNRMIDKRASVLQLILLLFWRIVVKL